MTNEIHIAFAVDRGYLKQVAVTIASIVANASTPEALRFYVVHADDHAWMSAQVARWGAPHVEVVRAENPFDERHWDGSHVSVSAMLRTLLPVALPHLDRVIYLDADIAVLHDIGELWRFDLGEAAMAGVVDLGMYIQIARGELHKNFVFRDCMISLGLDPGKPEYVNSGVLLMNLDKLRAMDFARLAGEMDRARGGDLIFVDQDIINALLRGHMALLDPRWNVHTSSHSRQRRRWHHYIPDMLKGALDKQKAEQWAIHYIGRNKPWLVADVWRSEDWWRYADASGFEGARPAPLPRTLATRLGEGWVAVRAKLSELQYRWYRRGGQNGSKG